MSDSSIPPNDWKRVWTVGDCIARFRDVPAIFKVLNRDATVAGVWHYLTLEMQSRLEMEFAYYDLHTGRT